MLLFIEIIILYDTIRHATLIEKMANLQMPNHIYEGLFRQAQPLREI